MMSIKSLKILNVLFMILTTTHQFPRLMTAFLAASSMSSAGISGIPLSVRMCFATSTFVPEEEMNCYNVSNQD